MSQNYLKNRRHRGIDVVKVPDGEKVVFGRTLYVKKNGGLVRANAAETNEFIKEYNQRREQQQ